MNTVAQLSAGIAALVLIAVFPLEAFFIDRPGTQRFLGIEPHGIRNVHLWSFCIGARNALSGVGTLIGLWMVNFDHVSTGTILVVVGCIYMLLASLFMGIASWGSPTCSGTGVRAEEVSGARSRPRSSRRSRWL